MCVSGVWLTSASSRLSRLSCRYRNTNPILIVFFLLEAVVFALFALLRWQFKDNSQQCGVPVHTCVTVLGTLYCLVTLIEIILTHLYMDGSQAFREALSFISLLPILATVVENTVRG